MWFLRPIRDLVLSGALLLAVILSSPAYQAPLTDVSANVQAEDFDLVVRYDVFDPVLGDFQVGQRRYEGTPYDSWTVSTLDVTEGVVVWLALRSGNFSVRDAEVGCALYDPARQRWMQHRLAYPASLLNHWSISQLTVTGTTVAWRGQETGDGNFRDSEAAYACYDPARGAWIFARQRYQGSTLTYWAVTNLVAADGLIAWRAQPLGTSSTYDSYVGLATYDTEFGRWVEQEQLYEGTPLSWWRVSALLTRQGLVTWQVQTVGSLSPFDVMVGFATYDTSRHTWKRSSVAYDGEEEDPWTISNLTITDQRVRWTARDRLNFLNETRGYNHLTALWGRTANSPYAAFAQSTTNGTAPAAVWFSDHSLGATAWEWDFGDDTTSEDRDPYHVFGEPGTYTTRLTISGPSGTQTAQRTFTILASSNTLSFDVASAQVTNGQFRVTLTGLPASASTVVWVSTNLLFWQPLQTNAPGSPTATVTDSLPASAIGRFYRASVLSP